MTPDQNPQALIGQFNTQISRLVHDALEHAYRAHAFRTLQEEAATLGRRGVAGMLDSMSAELREDISRTANQYQTLRFAERLERLAPELNIVLGPSEWNALQAMLDGRKELIQQPLSETTGQYCYKFVNLAAELERELPAIRLSLQQHAASSLTAQREADRLIRQCDWVGGKMRSVPISDPRQQGQHFVLDLTHAAQLSDALCAAKLQAASQLYSQASMSLLAEGFETRGLRKLGLDDQTMRHVADFTAQLRREPFSPHPPLADRCGGTSVIIGKLQQTLKSRGAVLQFTPLTEALLTQAGIPSPSSWLGRDQGRTMDGHGRG